MLLVAQCDRCDKVVYLPEEEVVDTGDELLCIQCHEEQDPIKQNGNDVAEIIAKAWKVILFKREENKPFCPSCGSDNVAVKLDTLEGRCNDCGLEFGWNAKTRQWESI